LVEPLVAKMRRLASRIGPEMPLTEKRKKLCWVTPAPLSMERTVEVPKLVEGCASSTYASASGEKAKVSGEGVEVGVPVAVGVPSVVGVLVDVEVAVEVVVWVGVAARMWMM
jgi:hypothetical protein